MNKLTNFLKINRSYILLFLIVLLALRVFVPQLDELKEALLALKGADKGWFLFGVVIYWAGLPVLASQFIVIAKKSIPFWQTLKVQIAGLFVSKLLPSSLGTLTLNTYYLTVRKHTVHEAASVMAMNGLTSGVAYFTLIIVAIGAANMTAGWPLADKNVGIWIIVGMSIILLGLYALAQIPALRRFGKQRLGGILENLVAYKHNRRGVLVAILLNGIGSLTSNFALYASAQAVGMDVTLPQAFLAYTFGNIAAALVPTPGGLGATEAGLYSSFILLGFDPSQSMSTVMLYRLISFWIPTIPGYIAFWNLRKDVLAKFSIRSSRS